MPISPSCSSLALSLSGVSFSACDSDVSSLLSSCDSVSVSLLCVSSAELSDSSSELSSDSAADSDMLSAAFSDAVSLFAAGYVTFPQSYRL